VESWSFLTSHARVLLCIAADPGERRRDIAAGPGITERSAAPDKRCGRLIAAAQ
jgi:hypothetical protein